MRKTVGCILVGGLLLFSLLAIPAGLTDVNNVSGLHGIAIGLSVFWGLVLLVGLVYLVKYIIELRTKRLKQLKERLSQKDMIIAQIVATHTAWYPAHNEGREPPRGAQEAWIKKLQASSLTESELILLVEDNKSRNMLLGKTWP